MYVCTLSAHLTQSTFLCVALVVAVAVAVVGHQALLLLLLWFILCLISSALCYRCVWVIMYMHICVCNHFFVHISWLPCLSLKKPISFRMCISFIWKRWIEKTPNHIQKKIYVCIGLRSAIIAMGAYTIFSVYFFFVLFIWILFLCKLIHV